MSITINITPAAQEELIRQAIAHGAPVEDYAATLLERAVTGAGAIKALTTDRLESTLRELAQFSQKIPLLPDEAFTREGIYQDHE